MDCTPSMTNSRMVLDFEITLGQSATMTIHAFDDDGLAIEQARGRFFEIVVQKAPNGRKLTKRSQFKDKMFMVTFDNEDLGSVGKYKIWVDGWNNGRSKKALKYDVLAHSSDTLLPTKSRPHTLEVKSNQIKKFIAGGLAVVIGASLGTAFVYARRNPGTTQKTLHCNQTMLLILCLLSLARNLQSVRRFARWWQANLVLY